MDAFFGSWILDKTDHFTEYLSAIGVSDEQISVAQKLQPSVNFCQDGDFIVVKSVNTVFTREGRFKLGEEFSEKTRDGRQTKNIITLDGNKLVHVQKWDGKQTTFVREVTDGHMVMTLTFGDVVATLTYVKIHF